MLNNIRKELRDPSKSSPDPVREETIKYVSHLIDPQKVEANVDAYLAREFSFESMDEKSEVDFNQ